MMRTIISTMAAIVPPDMATLSGFCSLPPGPSVLGLEKYFRFVKYPMNALPVLLPIVRKDFFSHAELVFFLSKLCHYMQVKSFVLQIVLKKIMKIQ